MDVEAAAEAEKAEEEKAEEEKAEAEKAEAEKAERVADRVLAGEHHYATLDAPFAGLVTTSIVCFFLGWRATGPPRVGWLVASGVAVIMGAVSTGQTDSATALGALVGDELPAQIRQLRGREAVRRDGLLGRRRRAAPPRRPGRACLVLELLGALSSARAAPPPPGLAPRDLEVVRRAARHDARRRRAAAAHLAILA